MSTTRGSPRGAVARDVALVVGGTLLAGLLAFLLAPLGTASLYALVALLAFSVLAWSLRGDLAGPLADAAARLPRRRGTRRGPVAATAWLLAVVLVSGVLAWLLAQRGGLAVLGLVAALTLTVAGWLLWPLVHDLLTTPAEDLPARGGRNPAAVPTTTDHDNSNGTGQRPGSDHRLAHGLGLSLVVVAAAVAAWAAAQLGLKGLLAIVGAGLVLVVLVVARDRSVVFTFLTVASLTFVLHKSLSAQDLTLSGGAISIYVTTFDAALLVLYGLWISEGTFLADARAGIRRPLIWLPLVAVLFLLPSLLVASSPLHGASELVRMGWMYLLYFYVAVRVRTRRHVWAVLAGLAVFALIELVVVVLQWRTGGVLGLSFLGVPTQLGERVTDTDTLGRPFGTIIHPVFMGAVLGMLALVAVAMAIDLRRSLTKIAAVALVPVCLLPLYLAHTRAALVAVLVVLVGVVVAGLVRGRITPRTVGRICLGLLVIGLLALPQLIDRLSENFGTAHFFEEVASRQELNVIAMQMFTDHWGIGVGLNNFELALPAYEPHEVIFFGNPVHNIYLLWLSETGIVGFVGVALLGALLLLAAIRLARSDDRLLGGIGIGVTAAMAFLLIEELLGFSLRQDIPLAMYWLLAGLVVACLRIAAHEPAGPQAPQRRPARRPRPPRPPTAPRVPDVDPAADHVPLDELLSGHLARRVAASTSPDRGAGSRSRPAARRSGRWSRPRSTAERARPSTAAAGERARGLAHSRLGRARTGPDRTGRRTRPGSAGRGTGRRRQVGAALGLGGLLWSLLLVPPGRAADDGARVTFAATVRATGSTAIFVARGDGSELTRITPEDGRTYSWPRWAYGTSKIVFSLRSGPPGSPEAIALMNPDGSDVQILGTFDFQVGQPSIDPSGQWLYFTGAAPWFPRYAVFRMNLRTLESVNLTAVTSPLGGADTDLALTADGTHLVVTTSDGDSSAINVIDVNGNGRRAVTHDSYYNADAGAAPDGSAVALSSYRGDGDPKIDGGTGVQPGDWHLVVVDLHTGTERVLTAGQDCTQRPVSDPCEVAEMSAFVPRYTPDGTDIVFDGALDHTRTCLCAIAPNGSNPRVILASSTLAIGWADWAVPRDDGGDPGRIGSQARDSTVLVTMSRIGGANQLVLASPDLMHRRPLDLPDGLVPEQARLAPDGRTIVFTARVRPRAADRRPHPAPPRGAQRRDHVTLADIDAVALARRATALAALPAHAERLQVFLRLPNGTVRQLTDPWLEDWRDGVAPGDARANTDPVFTPDGRAVIVTNTSTTTGESFLLRIDLDTGAVLNLTNATAGALPVDDADGAVAPDGRHVAFAWTRGSITDIYVMDPDGDRVRNVTDDAATDSAPAWLPDGSGLVYARTTAAGTRIARVRFDPGRVDRTPSAVTPATEASGIRPVVAPEGDRVLFPALALSTRSVYAAPADGSGPPRLLQPDVLHNVAFVDWR